MTPLPRSLLVTCALACGLLAPVGGHAADTPPRPLHVVKPVHPPELFARAVEGSATVVFGIDVDGHVVDASVMEATQTAFGEAALAAVRQWSFAPATRDGVAVAIPRVRQEFNFPVSLPQKLTVRAGRQVFFDPPAGVVEESALSAAPAAVKPFAPEYPAALAGTGRTGEVELAFIINPEGLAINPELVRFSDQAFALAALDALVQARWEPPQVDGRAVPAHMAVTVVSTEGQPVQVIAKAQPPPAPATTAPALAGSAAEAVATPAPDYPPEMKRRGISGRVVVGFIVDADGAVQDAYVVESSRPEFEKAALAAVRGWKFRPARKDGRAVAVRMQVPLTFDFTKS